MVDHIIQPRFSTDALVPISELQRAPGRIIARAHRDNGPLAVTQRGRVVAVLLPPPQYATLVTQGSSSGEERAQRKRELLRALDEMLPVIIQHYQPEKVILFGSLAGDTVGVQSDIDLVILKQTRKRALDRRREVLRLVRPRIATDFFVYTPEEFRRGLDEQRPFFVREVVQKGKVLYEKAP